MQSTVIPPDETSPVRITLGERFTEFTADGADIDAIGIELVGGVSYRITLDPADATVTAKLDPLIGDILSADGASLGASDDDSGSGAASVLIFTPPATALYFILVSPQGPNDVGGWWTLEVNEFSPPADDFGAGLAPASPVMLWQTRDGRIETEGDIDTIPIFLNGGISVDITVYGNDVGYFGELSDVEILNFRDADGAAIDAADYNAAHAVAKFTSGVDADAHQLSFTPDADGIYYITVGAGSGVGDYSVSVSEKDRGVHSIRASELYVSSGNLEADIFFIGAQDTEVDHIYTDRNGDGVTTLTYSVPGESPAFSPAVHNVIASEWTVNYAPAGGAVLNTYFAAMAQVSAVANIEFVEVPDDGVEAGTFRIGTSDLPIRGPNFLANGWSGFPRWTMAGETWINLTQAAGNIAGSPLALGPYLVNRTLHEFTHNLGLNHPDRSTLAGGVDAAILGQEYSVMSRTLSGIFDGAFPDILPQTLMWLDIQALQAAYGVNTASTGGDDTYSFDTSKRHFSTLWDAGGEDTLALTGGEDARITLAPGVWQDVGTIITYYDGQLNVVGARSDTVLIAPGVIIEHATGAAGDDRLTGNGTANRLIGASGDDTLRGRAGEDSLFGGFGADRIDGGADDDLIRSGPDNDTLIGGDGDDTLGASNRTDLLRGGDGRDLMLGSNGNDRIFGDDGADTLLGGNGRDTIEGGEGDDRLVGGAGADRIRGGQGADTLIGGDGSDRFAFNAGEAGDDLIIGFEAGPGSDDFIILLGFGATLNAFSDVLTAASENGDDTKIDLGGGASLTLRGVGMAALDADDFIFG